MKTKWHQTLCLQLPEKRRINKEKLEKILYIINFYSIKFQKYSEQSCMTEQFCRSGETTSDVIYSIGCAIKIIVNLTIYKIFNKSILYPALHLNLFALI